ncbi:DUF6862 domain-containing protein, partial [Yersinia enterocolitica]
MKSNDPACLHFPPRRIGQSPVSQTPAPPVFAHRTLQAEKLVTDLDAKDKAFDAAIDAACKNLSSEQCSGMR